MVSTDANDYNYSSKSQVRVISTAAPCWAERSLPGWHCTPALPRIVGPVPDVCDGANNHLGLNASCQSAAMVGPRMYSEGVVVVVCHNGLL
jgi:hypothetical protein